jgi:isopenicillin N synthase-like dioxygenase
VQELAAGVVEPPSQFVLQEQDRPESLLLTSNLPEPIPVIDLSRLAAAEEASKLRSALQTWGLFLVSRSVYYLPHLHRAVLAQPRTRCATNSIVYFVQVTNHGIEASLMDHVMAASRDFFHQPLHEKQKFSNLIGGKRFQMEGYGNDMVTSQDQILDWQDRLQLRVEPEDERNLAYWPKHPDSFRLSTRLLEISSPYVIEGSEHRNSWGEEWGVE